MKLQRTCLGRLGPGEVSARDADSGTERGSARLFVSGGWLGTAIHRCRQLGFKQMVVGGESVLDGCLGSLPYLPL